MSFTNFQYSQSEFASLADELISTATKLGATSAQVEVSESKAKSVDILNGEIENFETSHEQIIGITVYVGNKRGVVGSSGVMHVLTTIVEQAVTIARASEADPYNQLPDKQYLCDDLPPFELELHNPHEISNEELIAHVQQIERLGTTLDGRIHQSDGASISMISNNFRLANSNGFNLGYQTTRYSNSLSLIGTTAHGMQTDSWYSVSRDYQHLISNTELAHTAVHRVARRLNHGKAKSGTFPVIFESDIAKSIIGNFLSAISGNNQFRKLSFLTNAQNMQIMPQWLNIYEDPFIVKGIASCYFAGCCS